MYLFKCDTIIDYILKLKNLALKNAWKTLRL